MCVCGRTHEEKPCVMYGSVLAKCSTADWTLLSFKDVSALFMSVGLVVFHSKNNSRVINVQVSSPHSCLWLTGQDLWVKWAKARPCPCLPQRIFVVDERMCPVATRIEAN